jgi:uncharacterized protein YcsI (UPF0317 family)
MMRYMLGKECDLGWWTQDVAVVIDCADLIDDMGNHTHEMLYIFQKLNELYISNVDIISSGSLTVSTQVVNIRCYRKEDIVTIQDAMANIETEHQPL